jgi:hypothetical protein
MHARFGREPEQRHIGKFLEFVVANLPQQSPAGGGLHHGVQGCESGFDRRMLIGVDGRLRGLSVNAEEVERIRTRLSGPHGAMDRLRAVLLSHPRELDLDQLRFEPNGLPVERQRLPDIEEFR